MKRDFVAYPIDCQADWWAVLDSHWEAMLEAALHYGAFDPDADVPNFRCEETGQGRFSVLRAMLYCKRTRDARLVQFLQQIHTNAASYLSLELQAHPEWAALLALLRGEFLFHETQDSGQ